MKPLYRKNKNNVSNPFVQQQVYLPKSTARLLKEHSRRLGLPLSRLICIAIDNELDCERPFNYPSPDVDGEAYVEYMYAHEAGRLMEFLATIPTGTGEDMLLIARRDFGLEDRRLVMLAIRELIMTGMAERVPPPPGNKFGFYNEDYEYVRLVKDRTRKGKWKKRYTIETKDNDDAGIESSDGDNNNE